jgi:hypothetical protein
MREDMNLGPWLLLAFVVVILTGTALRIQFRRRSTAEDRRAAQGEQTRFEGPVGAKYRLASGAWSTKTLGGLRLVVGEHHWSLVLRYRWLGAVLGSEWVYPAVGTLVSFGRLPGDPLRREWLVLDATSLPHGAALAVRVAEAGRAWDSLIQIGAMPAT